MSTTTANLELFKYNTTADASTPFSINTALNDNWDKIDAFAGGIDTLFNGDLSDATGKNLFSDINTELGKKLEADVLLEENGYIKFNNGLIIQFLFCDYNTSAFVFPISFTTFATTVCTLSTTGGTQQIGWAVIYSQTLTGIQAILRHYYSAGDYNIIAIGY